VIDIDLKDMERFLGLATALSEGDTTPAEAFPSPEKDNITGDRDQLKKTGSKKTSETEKEDNWADPKDDAKQAGLELERAVK